MLRRPLPRLAALSLPIALALAASSKAPEPKIPFDPPTYVCYRASAPVQIDGDLDEDVWIKAPWSENFVDIEGGGRPKPRFRTMVKLLWDDDYLYIGAYLEEPNVWATLTKRDSIIFLDNDFEVFIDPDADTHEYYEFEMNALNTVWDLLLIKPYRDGGPAVNGWDIHGLRSAVRVDGTLNDARDRDRGWTVELAFPWDALRECAHRDAPPRDGDQWRINFSRVEWRVNVNREAGGAGAYAKAGDPATGKPLPEDNWVWSPQGLINMHYPEMWGVMQFATEPAGGRSVEVRKDPADAARWALRRVYYGERRFHEAHGRFADRLLELGLHGLDGAGIRIETTAGGFEARIAAAALSIDQEGRLRRLEIRP